MKINCQEISNQIRNEIKEELKFFPKLKLAVIRIGDDEASKIYVNQKEKACLEVGIDFEKFEYPKEISKFHIKNKIIELNEDKNITGILLQLPLPNELKEYQRELIDTIDYRKDVDGLTTTNKMNLSQNLKTVIPCTALGIKKILDNLIKENILNTLTGKNVVIIGKSDLIGRPLSLMLYDKCTVTNCDINTTNLEYYTKNADIIITATGKEGLITDKMVKESAIVIDAGITRVDNKIKGDFKTETEDIIYTPVPNGVGVMTVTSVLSNIIDVYKKFLKLES